MSPNALFYPICAGVSYPDPDYVIERENSTTIIIECIEKGRGYIEVGGGKYLLTKGDCCIIPSMAKHKYYSDKNDPYTKKWVNIKGSVANGLMEFYFGDRLPIIAVCDIAGEIDEITGIVKSGEKIGERILPFFTEILLKMRNNLTGAKESGGTLTDIAEKIRFYINNHIQDDISLMHIGEEMHLSQSHMIRVFKKKYGVTPYRYYIERKVNLAEKLLKNSDMTIDVIAEKLNFSDRNHFSAVFTKITGVTPGRYRKQK